MLKQIFSIAAIIFSSFWSTAQGVELFSERDMYSKSYAKPNGNREKVISVSPLHYFENNQWMEVDNTLQLHPNGFTNESNVIRSFFPETIGVNNFFSFYVNGKQVSTESMKQLVSYDPQGGVSELPEIGQSTVAQLVSSNQLEYPSIFTDVTDRYIVESIGIKNECVLHALPAFFASSTKPFLGFREAIHLPAGWSIVPQYPSSDELIRSGLNILDEHNDVVLELPAPVFFDNGGLNDDGFSAVQGGFLVDKVNGVWLLSTLVPSEWLQSTERLFPVVIDPTITLPGIDGGWMSANNLVNNPGFAFIGVCCGNLEHRAWIKYNTTTIPDNSCILDVNLEVNVNGVGTSITELVHAFDITGAPGPYPAIDPNVLLDMETGYYTSFTLSGVGVYGWYDLGPSADALLQSQLPVNWFQVALIFDNEPSTNWKRLTATLCNLRIEYSAPPCVVLPVGMVDFEVECKNERPFLTWSTVSEDNNDFFTIWESFDAENFREVAKISGSGNSSEKLNYSWLAPTSTDQLKYYRLSQTDYDGTTEVFETKAFYGCSMTEPTVFIAKDKTIHVEGTNIIEVRFFDQLGSELVLRSVRRDHNAFVFANPNLPVGTYTAIIEHGNHQTKRSQFVISNK